MKLDIAPLKWISIIIIPTNNTESIAVVLQCQFTLRVLYILVIDTEVQITYLLYIQFLKNISLNETV